MRTAALKRLLTVPGSKRAPFLILFLIALALAGWGVAWRLSLRALEPRVLLERPKPSKAESKVAATFRELTSDTAFAGAAIGFCLLDENGKPVFASPLAETALCPASSLKTVTTGAALGILGLDFTFETSLFATAEIDAEGALDGDLMLLGSGDPTLSSDDLGEMADAAIAAGLKKVTGRIRVDATRFPPNPVNDHWVWGDIGNGYGVGAFGLNLDRNRIGLRFEPAEKAGAPAGLLDHSSAPTDIRWENFVTTGPTGSGDQVVVYSEPYGRTITMRGTVPAGESGFAVSAANPDPAALAIEVLRARLEAGGVAFSDAAQPEATPPRTRLAAHRSKPLPEIVDHLHRMSDNLEAQSLFLTIGWKQDTDPVDAVKAYWEKAGVACKGWRLIDGSGLARANMIRPLDLAGINFAARRSGVGQRFYDSLTAYHDGQVRAKVGSMSGVLTQVGFLRTAQGSELTFACMANGLTPGADFWGLIEALLEAARTEN